MIINVDKLGAVAEFENIVEKTVKQANVKGLLILACDANGFTPQTLDHTLQNVAVPVFGGIFPEIICGKEKLTKGTIIAGLSIKPNIQIIPALSDMTVDYDTIIDEKFPNIDQAKTMFVLVDGLSKRISALIDSLFNIFGLEVNYIGGGAGSLSFVQKPCLFTNQGLIEDSAVLALLTMESGVGVSHGWTSISGPFKVTESDQNIIKSLDWQPAFAVYQEVVEKESGQQFTDNNFFELAKKHPFGINKLGAEKIVRDPIMLGQDNSLICVGEVPEESYVDILAGDVPSLVQAAKKALELGQQAFKADLANPTTFFIDCISRVLFLEEEFQQELNAVYVKDAPMIGALTLGEIANSGKDYLEFYNKTAVVGVLGG